MMSAFLHRGEHGRAPAEQRRGRLDLIEGSNHWALGAAIEQCASCIELCEHAVEQWLHRSRQTDCCLTDGG